MDVPCMIGFWMQVREKQANAGSPFDIPHHILSGTVPFTVHARSGSAPLNVPEGRCCKPSVSRIEQYPDADGGYEGEGHPVVVVQIRGRLIGSRQPRVQID